MVGPEYPLLEKYLPVDHSRVSTSEDMIREAYRDASSGPSSLLDLGCGAGNAVDFFAQTLPGALYHGVDIEGSPEASSRTRVDASFRSYDGQNLPYDDRYFDLVYSRQVFEHVRHPDVVVHEIFRVLRPGGLFIGSMSNLEPYHSFSIFNYTPYGVYRLLEDNGFKLRCLRPGPESLSLIARQITSRRICNFRLIYPAVRVASAIRGWDIKRENYLKLRFSGHICFIAQIPTEPVGRTKAEIAR